MPPERFWEIHVTYNTCYIQYTLHTLMPYEPDRQNTGIQRSHRVQQLQQNHTQTLVITFLQKPGFQDYLGKPVSKCQTILGFLQQEVMGMAAMQTWTLNYAKLQSDYHHYQHTNTQFLHTQLFILPNQQC